MNNKYNNKPLIEYIKLYKVKFVHTVPMTSPDFLNRLLYHNRIVNERLELSIKDVLPMLKQKQSDLTKFNLLNELNDLVFIKKSENSIARVCELFVLLTE